MTFAFTSGRTVLPTSSVQVAVAPAGDIWPYYTNAGITGRLRHRRRQLRRRRLELLGQALAAGGVTPGSTVTADGCTTRGRTRPGRDPGQHRGGGPDHPARGPAGASTIGLLGSGSNADSTGAGGTVTVHYTDGTSSTFDAFFSDWTLAGGSGTPVPGNTVAVTAAYRNSSGGRDPVKTYVFSVTAPLTPARRSRASPCRRRRAATRTSSPSGSTPRARARRRSRPRSTEPRSRPPSPGRDTSPSPPEAA